jgi:hypothetical protein
MEMYVLAILAATVLWWFAGRKPVVLASPSSDSAAATSPDIRDKLDETNVAQLHQAVVQFGSNCFELKKLCVTALFAAATLLATLTEKQLDTAFFVAALITVVIFWLLDAQSYYYQDKLRARMKKVSESIAQRHNVAGYVDGVGMPMSEKRENRVMSRRVAAALFNLSMFFYAAVGVIVLSLLLLHAFGYIDNTAFVRVPPSK